MLKCYFSEIFAAASKKCIFQKNILLGWFYIFSRENISLKAENL